MRSPVWSGTAMSVRTFCSTMLWRARKASSSCASRTSTESLRLSTRSRTAVLMWKPSPLLACAASSPPSRVITTPRRAPTASTARSRITGNRSLQRPVPGQLAAGFDQRLYRRGSARAGVVDAGLVGERSFQAGDEGGRTGGFRFVAFEDHHRGGARGTRVVDDSKVAGGDAVARLEPHLGLHRVAVDEGAVLAAQVLHHPRIAVGFEQEVLAGEPGVLGERDFSRARAANGEARAGERDGIHLPVGAVNDDFMSHSSV